MKKQLLSTLVLGVMLMPFIASCGGNATPKHECAFYPVAAVDPTCAHTGNIAYDQCIYCKKIQVEGVDKTLEDVTLPIDPTNHENSTHYDEVPSSCIADGTKAYDYCTACMTYTIDGTVYTQDTLEDNLILHKEDASHDLIDYPEQQATCQYGMKAHSECSVCHKLFVDGKEVNEADLLLQPVSDHSFDQYGICSVCDVFKYDEQVFDSSSIVEATPVTDDYGFSYTIKEDMGELFVANRMTFGTQLNVSKTSANYDGDTITFTYSDQDNTFTRFAPGVDGKSYVGEFYFSFDVVVGDGLTINRLGARITDKVGDLEEGTEANQSLLIGRNGTGSENNASRTLNPGSTYRFIYKMRTANAENLVQIFACPAFASDAVTQSTIKISNIHFVPVKEEAGDVSSQLLYFGLDDQKKNEKDIEVNKVTIDQGNFDMLVDGTTQLTATVEPDNAADKTLTWSSDDPEIATVDQTGKVTGVSAGTTTIRARSVNGIEATCKVTVLATQIHVDSVSLDQTTLSIKETGAPVTLKATVLPENAFDKSVTWKSSDEKVATVADGVVTPVGPGEATITVTTNDGNKTAECVVTVEDVDVNEYYLFNGNDFFNPANWYESTSTTARGDEIVDEEHNLTFTSDTASRIDMFHVGTNESGSYVHLGDSKDKWTGSMEDNYNVDFTYDMTMSSTGSFYMMLLGIKDSYRPTDTGKNAFWAHFEEGKITLIGNSSYPDNIASFVCETDAFKFNQANKVSIVINRIDGGTLSIKLLINDVQVKFAGETVSGTLGEYSVDTNGTFTSKGASSGYLNKTSYGQRFGITPEGQSETSITSLEITPAPEQPAAPGEKLKSYEVFNGKDFFDPQYWDDSTKDANPRDNRLLDSEGNLVFSDGLNSRFDLFHCGGSEGSYIHFGDSATKAGIEEIVGKSSTYTMGVEADGEFDMMILGVSGAYGPTTSGAACLYLHFGSDGTISLSMTGPNTNHFDKQFTGASTFKLNEVNQVSLTLTRVDINTLSLKVTINGTNVVLQGDAVITSSHNYKVDENGVFTSDLLSTNGMGQRFGMYPSQGSTVTISSLEVK